MDDAGLLEGVIVTHSESNAGRIGDVLDYLRDNGICTTMFIIARRLGRNRTRSPLPAAEILDGKVQVLERLLRSPPAPVDVAMLQVLKRFVHPPSKMEMTRLACAQPFCHAGIHTLMFDALGRIFPCGLSCNVEEVLLGYLDRLDPYHYHSLLRTFHRKGYRYKQECPVCDAACICGFGCSIEGEIADEECHAWQLFYDHLRQLDIDMLRRALAAGDFQVRANGREMKYA